MAVGMSVHAALSAFDVLWPDGVSHLNRKFIGVGPTKTRGRVRPAGSNPIPELRTFPVLKVTQRTDDETIPNAPGSVNKMTARLGCGS